MQTSIFDTNVTTNIIITIDACTQNYCNIQDIQENIEDEYNL